MWTDRSAICEVCVLVCVCKELNAYIIQIFEMYSHTRQTFFEALIMLLYHSLEISVFILVLLVLRDARSEGQRVLDYGQKVGGC